MTAVSSAAENAPRKYVGRYEVHHEIGSGSTGTVFLARDPVIGRWVALKTLSRDITVDSKQLEAFRERLLNEARSAGTLSHPGIVAVHDVIEEVVGDAGATDEERISIAMEYVEGTDLRRKLDQPDPLPLEFIGSVVSQVGEVLTYAHSRGVVHRDIKPANILLGVDGQIKVTDFGIASIVGEDLSHDLKHLGSPNYLAPERILGQPADAAGDVYALGVVLYEMLTRNPPFYGDSLGELARNIVQEKPTPVDHYRHDLFPEIQEIVDRALAKEPTNRYPGPTRLAADFEMALKRRSRRNDTVPTTEMEELRLAPEILEDPDPQDMPLAASTEAGAEEAKSEQAAAVAAPSRRTPILRRWAIVLPVLAALAAGASFLLNRSVDPGDAGQSTKGLLASPEVPVAELQYRRLLGDGRNALAVGDYAGASRLVDHAEELNAGDERAQWLREAIRRRAEGESAALAEAEVLESLDRAREAIERRRLTEASRILASVLEIDPANEEARQLETYVRGLRQRRTTFSRRPARPRPVVAEEQVAEAEPEQRTFEPFTPIVTAAPAAIQGGTGDLRVDFYSERPRGVLTVYVGTRQILNRKYRFVEKKNLIKRQGLAGGFDERARLKAGDLDLRIYLTLPGKETQLRKLQGTLPGDSLRTLRVRVDQQGQLTAVLH